MHGTTKTRLLREAQGGPSWLDSDDYEIVAKAEGNPSNEQMGGPMLQALLEERFRLKVHRDEKEVPVYFLKVAKGGPRFQPAKKESCVTSDADNPSPLTSPEKPLPGYAEEYGSMAEGSTCTVPPWQVLRPNLPIFRSAPHRQTGLTGVFDIHMDLVPEDCRPAVT